ncbi:lipase (class 3) domain-containing protein [Sarocladium implicatum]|nr:lipase (class 3) domain-containing protein [Sarocladium implicatum]
MVDGQGESSTVPVLAVGPHSVSPPAPTLLPTPIANAVSLATRSTGFAIRLGSLVGSCSLNAARFTTLSSLELARGMLEGVLVRAGGDPALRSRSDFADTDAETVLERSLESLHYAVTQVVFWTAASFHLTGSTIAAVSGVSQMLLSSLDQLFGSTDSSRAIATIVTLIRREFKNPKTGQPGETVGVADLILAFSALASLQQGCFKLPEEHQRRHVCEEVIWDVVVLNDGERVDVQEPSSAEPPMLPPRPDPRGAASMPNNDLAIAHLKEQIVSSLAPGTTVSISDTVSNIQTITVDVDAPEPLSLPTPPGAEIIETKALAPTDATDSRPGSVTSVRSQYRVVYRIERNKLHHTSLRHEDGAAGPSVVETFDDHWSPPRSLPSPSGSESPPLEIAGSRRKRPQIADRSQSAPAVPPSPEQEIARARQPPPDDRVLRPEAAVIKKDIAQKADATEISNQKKRRSPPQQIPWKENHKSKLRAESSILQRKSSKKKLSQGLDVSLMERDKKNSLKQALKEGSQSISNIWTKDTALVAKDISPPPRPQWKTPGGREATSVVTKSKLPRNLKVPSQRIINDPRALQPSEPNPRSSSRASFVSVREHRRDSVTSQTEAYMMGATDLRRSASQSSLQSEIILPSTANGPQAPAYSGLRAHRRTSSHVPSLYSLQTNDSQTSLVLSQYLKKSVYSASDAINTLRREGFVDGTFPAGHILSSITRYMRFSSASYGSHFLKMTGVSPDVPALRSRDEPHHDVRHFLHHTESDAGSVLLASFVDPSGGSDSTGSTDSGVPLVHYISLDHSAKAVVLACRGTLGFEDILADLTCDYDNLIWRGRTFRVHKGIHASARRLLEGSDGRVLITIQEALREFPDYGLVLTGHSLGAGVAALLGVMLSEPNSQGIGFVTSSRALHRTLSSSTPTSAIRPDISLPTGRRIHVYAYGPPGVMSLSLCKLTKGLITSVVHGNDIVPHLSLGLLHDFQSMALAFKADETNVKRDLRTRMWNVFQESLSDTWHSTASATTSANDDRHWMLPALQELRKNMTSEKLLPPGEVFTIESQKVLRRDAFLLDSEADHLGKPAQRVVLKYVRDVPARFGEVRFGTSMLMDHTPARYEEALRRLQVGITE